ncbi:MAG: 30S ribosomal protein S3 [Planctomycetota bacterium]|nr:MAG: 30S ribosomal protein S3 [Planctomycetota bacterium]
MGQKVHPNGFRVGITKRWNSRWIANKETYGTWLVEDQLIKRFVRNSCHQAGVEKVQIERTNGQVKIFIFAARPGIIIGKKGSEIEKLNRALMNNFGDNISVDIREVKNVKTNAQLVAMNVAEQLEKRTYFRRAMNKAIESAVEDKCKGIKILLSGRLGGAEMARSEKQIFGSLPLGTLEVDIDYGFAEATTTYGQIGVKVWINKGYFRDKVEEI